MKNRITPGIFIAKDKKISNFRIIRFRSKYKNNEKDLTLYVKALIGYLIMTNFYR